MRIAKIKFVVSCTASETDFGAENLLGNSENGRTKWKGKAGAPENVAVLQLERECTIRSVDIGNEFSALISVLVSKSCDQKQNFQTLIPSMSFMDPMESRLAKNGNRVRMFRECDMIAVTAQQKWDIVKIVCTQPFNQRISYGISFITVTVDGETDESAVTQHTVPKIPLITRVETVRNTLKPGEMFRRKENYKDMQMPSTSGTNKQEKSGGNEDEGKEAEGCRKHKGKLNAPLETKRLKLIGNKENETSIPNTSAESVAGHSALSKTSSSKATVAPMKRKQQDTSEKKGKQPDITEKRPLNEVLRGVRFSLSGYQNPRRSILRDKAREMGAVYENDWSSRCTHLICAFRNTPKYRQVGRKGLIVTDKWIDMCYAKKKRLPERHFAL